MKDILKNTAQHLRRSIFHFRCSDFLREGAAGLYVEDYFHEMVYLERRRSERTGRPFVLMLADLGGFMGDEKASELASSAAVAIATGSREVDVKGWYSHNHVLGVLFTDTAADAIPALREKVAAALASPGSLGGRAGEVRLSFHPFPEQAEKEQKIPVDLKLYPDLSRKDNVKKRSIIAKRVMDIIGGLAGILLFSPFLIALPVIIKLTSRGPVLFKQERVGERGRRFTFLKFRSMYEGSDSSIHSKYVASLIREDKPYSEGDEGDRVYKIQDDRRVTPVGRFLRKTSLDELPQFLNVLTGDMSLVGPRPPIPYELENYGLWQWRRVIEARPGITGLWQVRGRSRRSYNDMVRLDLRYIDSWSLWLDIKIILLTPFSMLSSRDAY